MARAHRISISIAGQSVPGWTSYSFGSSMLDVVDAFTLTRPFNRDVYRLCRLDAAVKIKLDAVTVIDGMIGTRDHDADKDTHVMTITGRSKMGRVVQESAPTVGLDDIPLDEAVRRLASPWYTRAVFSNARNRTVVRGRGRKAAAADEALVAKVRKKTWQVEPGQTRWKIINDLASEAGYLVWPSGDGKELIIGQPNYKQGIQFLITNPIGRSRMIPTAIRFNVTESIEDRYSLIMALGSGQGDAANYGDSAVTRRDVVRDGPASDGTGRDFILPKRLILAERTLHNDGEAHQHATREMARRDFHKQVVRVTMPGHGQITGGSMPTLFAYDTIARVVDEETDPKIDGPYMIYDCKFKGSRDEETTELLLVPSGTVFAQ
jgi:prophage tail gpP-like protein